MTKIEKIEKYGELINDELGEYWLSIVQLYRRRDQASPEMEAALKKEIDDIVSFIDTRCRIKTSTIKHSTKVYEVIIKPEECEDEND